METYLSPRIDCTSLHYTEDSAWVLVLMAVLLCIGVTWFIGMSIWCVTHGYRGFSGNYELKEWGLKVYFECI